MTLQSTPPEPAALLINTLTFPTFQTTPHAPPKMSAGGYEVEHSIAAEEANNRAQDGRRPDLSTFYSALDQLDDSREARHNPHALPTPSDLAALYDLLADAIALMRGTDETQHLELVDQLRQMANNPPPGGVKSVPDSFLDALDRVPKKALKKDDQCNICGLPFLDDPYPLVVELPCHPSHRFDLECIRPWLKINTTCPLDRKDLLKKKTPPPPPPEDDEEEWDDQFA
ncbi:hypothetical protein IWX50DRAFT_653443 [Phyllosticta citricarpa]|uniref:RING-type domain-containing protein n=2 Tax=Phyllosticta TaxID=121621 RepID=A0ABR1MCT0_9PEZI